MLHVQAPRIAENTFPTLDERLGAVVEHQARLAGMTLHHWEECREDRHSQSDRIEALERRLAVQEARMGEVYDGFCRVSRILRWNAPAAA